MSDKSKKLIEFIKRAERKIGASDVSLIVSSSTFDAIVDDVEPSGDVRTNPNWKGYPVCLNVGIATDAHVECVLTDADDNVYEAILIVRDL